MKAVLISIQPKWCKKIASGEKTIEVRKTRPKIDTPFKCYIYRTTERVNEIVEEYDSNFKLLRRKKTLKKFSGEVIGEFVCDEISEIGNYEEVDHMLMPWVKDWETTKKLCENACMRDSDISEYLGEKKGYGWHISNLKIYDKPKELSEYIRECRQPAQIQCENCPYCNWHNIHHFCMDKRRTITRPPKSWCYVEELEK